MSTFQCCTVVFVQDAICFTVVERGAPRAGILHAVCCSSNSPSWLILQKPGRLEGSDKKYSFTENSVIINNNLLLKETSTLKAKGC